MIRRFKMPAMFRSRPKLPSASPGRCRKLAIEPLERRESAVGFGLLTMALAQVACFTAPAETQPELPIVGALTLAPVIHEALKRQPSSQGGDAPRSRALHLRLTDSALTGIG